MTRRDLSPHDFDRILSEHAARTAMLRALHPLNRPALDPSERDSEIRMSMGAVAIVFVLMAAMALVAIASLLVVAFGHVRALWPAASATARAALADLPTAQASLLGAFLFFIALGLLWALWPRRHAA